MEGFAINTNDLNEEDLKIVRAIRTLTDKNHFNKEFTCLVSDNLFIELINHAEDFKKHKHYLLVEMGKDIKNKSKNVIKFINFDLV